MTTYTIILDEGIVIRDEDGVIVSPCESADSPAFQAYVYAIVNDGYEPTVIQSRTQPTE
jgi:hypothetical protein